MFLYLWVLALLSMSIVTLICPWFNSFSCLSILFLTVLKSLKVAFAIIIWSFVNITICSCSVFSLSANTSNTLLTTAAVLWFVDAFTPVATVLLIVLKPTKTADKAASVAPLFLFVCLCFWFVEYAEVYSLCGIVIALLSWVMEILFSRIFYFFFLYYLYSGLYVLHDLCIYWGICLT